VQLIITPSKGKTHLLASQAPQTSAELAMRAHPRTTMCGRKISGSAGQIIDGWFGAAFDCASCAKVRASRTDHAVAHHLPTDD
jgi:hypothetical protein